MTGGLWSFNIFCLNTPIQHVHLGTLEGIQNIPFAGPAVKLTDP